MICSLFAYFRGNRELYEWQDYETVMNPHVGDFMGWLEIPLISVKLPIFHGTEETVLRKGVGHIEGSSLPAGEKTSHCLLAGHRGLPGAKLLTRLGEMQIGDEFYIYVDEKILIYEVMEISVIRPEDGEKLMIQEGKDLISLITCTPYGVNTHRLVVTGERRGEG